MNAARNALALVANRSQQLEKQEQVDKQLREMAESCPLTVATFLLDERQLHRDQFKDMSYLSVFGKLDFSAELMRQWDDRYREVEQTLQTPYNGACLRLYLMSRSINQVK